MTMYDADNTEDRGLTTEQIAAAGTAPGQEETPDAEFSAGAQDAEFPAGGQDAGIPAGAPDAGDGGVVTNQGPRASLLEDGELQSITMRWKDIQAEFVDEPTAAVKEADALVAELMQRLASMFATERAELETRWAGGTQVSTEDLRQGLRRYRSFFERLLAA
jgi:hypothetical protein